MTNRLALEIEKLFGCYTDSDGTVRIGRHGDSILFSSEKEMVEGLDKILGSKKPNLREEKQ